MKNTKGTYTNAGTFLTFGLGAVAILGGLGWVSAGAYVRTSHCWNIPAASMTMADSLIAWPYAVIAFVWVLGYLALAWWSDCRRVFSPLCGTVLFSFVMLYLFVIVTSVSI